MTNLWHSCLPRGWPNSHQSWSLGLRAAGRRCAVRAFDDPPAPPATTTLEKEQQGSPGCKHLHQPIRRTGGPEGLGVSGRQLPAQRPRPRPPHPGPLGLIARGERRSGSPYGLTSAALTARPTDLARGSVFNRRQGVTFQAALTMGTECLNHPYSRPSRRIWPGS